MADKPVSLNVRRYVRKMTGHILLHEVGKIKRQTNVRIYVGEETWYSMSGRRRNNDCFHGDFCMSKEEWTSRPTPEVQEWGLLSHFSFCSAARLVLCNLPVWKHVISVRVCEYVRVLCHFLNRTYQKHSLLNPGFLHLSLQSEREGLETQWKFLVQVVLNPKTENCLSLSCSASTVALQVFSCSTYQWQDVLFTRRFASQSNWRSRHEVKNGALLTQCSFCSNALFLLSLSRRKSFLKSDSLAIFAQQKNGLLNPGFLSLQSEREGLETRSMEVSGRSESKDRHLLKLLCFDSSFAGLFPFSLSITRVFCLHAGLQFQSNWRSRHGSKKGALLPQGNFCSNALFLLSLTKIMHMFWDAFASQFVQLNGPSLVCLFSNGDFFDLSLQSETEGADSSSSF